MSIFSKVKDFLIGGTAETATEVAEDIADIVERWKPGEGSRHEMVMEISQFIEQSYASARGHDHPMNSGIPLVDALVDGTNRLIRPWVTITIVGALFGYWDLPAPDSIPEQYWTMVQIILGFWFGGRFLVKDIPQAIASIRR